MSRQRQIHMMQSLQSQLRQRGKGNVRRSGKRMRSCVQLRTRPSSKLSASSGKRLNASSGRRLSRGRLSGRVRAQRVRSRWPLLDVTLGIECRFPQAQGMKQPTKQLVQAPRLTMTRRPKLTCRLLLRLPLSSTHVRRSHRNRLFSETQNTKDRKDAKMTTEVRTSNMSLQQGRARCWRGSSRHERKRW